MAYDRGRIIFQSHGLTKWWLASRTPVLAALVVNILAFGYLFFTYIYSNHIFPNIFSTGYPTFRTVLEGRWGADFIYLLQGGRAIPLLDLMLAVPVQIANGILFARLFNLRDAWGTFLAAALISVHPYVSDYYAFAGDHLPLVIGDSLILLAFHVVRLRLQFWWTIFIAAFLIQAGLSCYQPKVGLVATLWILLLIGRIAVWDGTTQSLRRSARELLLSGTSIIAGAILYMALLKISQWLLGNPATGHSHAEARLSLIDPSLVLHQARQILALTYESLFSSALFGASFKMLPGLLLIVLGIFIVIDLLSRKASIQARLSLVIVSVMAFALLPFAVHAPFMVSDRAQLAGRIMLPTAYLTVFPLLMLLLLRLGRARPVHIAVLVVALFMCYRFVLINGEVGHLAYLRTVHEFQFVNRVLARIEQKIDPSVTERYALVVVGRLPLPDALLPSVQARSNLSERGFISYREVELLNFLMARDVLGFPSQEQSRVALEYAAQHPVWPAEESVSVLNGEIVVVIFEPPHEHVTTTMIVP